MPIMKCMSEGKPGYKYGDSGHCYTGEDAKEMAMKQGKAIEMSKHRAKAEEILAKLKEYQADDKSRLL